MRNDGRLRQSRCAACCGMEGRGSCFILLVELAPFPMAVLQKAVQSLRSGCVTTMGIDLWLVVGSNIVEGTITAVSAPAIVRQRCVGLIRLKEIVIEQIDEARIYSAFCGCLEYVFRTGLVNNEVLCAGNNEVMYQLGDSERGVDASNNSASTNHTQPQAGVQDLHSQARMVSLRFVTFV